MTFAIHTFGCKVNIYESEYVINLLINHGYKMVDNFTDEADIYIINTCTVTNESDKKARKLINSVRRKFPDKILVVMGCYSQLNADKIEASIVIGNRYKSKLYDLICGFIKNREKIVKVSDISSIEFEDMNIDKFLTHTRAFVKIQDGCNAFCSYCVIPYARGGIRSKDMDKVISEVTSLVNNGYQEIVLTGIHTGRYGLEKNTNLETLLRKLVEIPNIFRIRLSSIEINEITDGIIDLIKNNKIMARHLHIPLQSGSNKILKLMNRKYDLEYFYKRIDKIRKEIDDISITTDLIVGFPNETDEDFNTTVDTLKKLKFSKIHTFPYSKRDGTVAASMENQIDDRVKKCRVKEVVSLSDLMEVKFFEDSIGKIYDGIIEGRRDGKKILITSNYIPVLVDSELVNNTRVFVKIESVDGELTRGVIVDEYNLI